MLEVHRWLWMLLACIGLTSSAQEARQIMVYIASYENFANPERGFYHQDTLLWLNEEQSPQELAFLAQLRAQGVSLLRWYLLIDEFRAGPINDETLAYLDEQFDVARQAGMKVIPRFAYSFPMGGEYPFTEPDGLLSYW